MSVFLPPIKIIAVLDPKFNLKKHFIFTLFVSTLQFNDIVLTHSKASKVAARILSTRPSANFLIVALS